jgi:hypothetical protein
VRHIEADIAALSAAQAACLAAARPFAKNGATSSNSVSAAAAAAGDSKYAGLRHELDRAYLAACKVTESREMIQVGRVTVCGRFFWRYQVTCGTIAYQQWPANACLAMAGPHLAATGKDVELRVMIGVVFASVG